MTDSPLPPMTISEAALAIINKPYPIPQFTCSHMGGWDYGGDMPSITVIDYMGSDAAVVEAARTSYGGMSKGDDKDRQLLRYLMEHKHLGPFEMIEMKWRVVMPEMVWRHFLRHRTGSWNLESGRYKKPSTYAYLPTSNEWRKQSSDNKQASSEERLSVEDGWAMSKAVQAHYQAGQKLYQQLLDLGVAKELARLPLSNLPILEAGYMKMNVRNVLHLLSLRTAPDAQLETQWVANMLAATIELFFPNTYQAWIDYSQTKD